MNKKFKVILFGGLGVTLSLMSIFMVKSKASGTTVVNAAHTKICELQDVSTGEDTLTATAAMTIVGDDLYCIRSTGRKEHDNAVVLQKIKNFTSSNRKISSAIIKTQKGSTGVARHANSITYYNGLFYIATLNNPNHTSTNVIAVRENGIIETKYTYDNTITSINYYDTVNGVPRFLVCVGHNASQNYYRFHLVRVSGTTFVKEKNFIVYDYDRDYKFERGNDSYYDPSTRKLYTTMFYEGEPVVKKNIICEYNVDLALIHNKEALSASRVIYANAGSESKFEIEGMCIYSGKKYVCTNTNDRYKVEGQDSVYSLYKSN